MNNRQIGPRGTRVVVPSPVGNLAIESDGASITVIEFHAKGQPSVSTEGVIDDARCQLDEYFRGARTAFDLPLAPDGTDFQRRVWAALLEIPYGHTSSYGELARRIQKPAAVRAVGAANGQNPIPIVIPCHRVIGSNGALVGFGGGLEVKRFLLNLEQRKLF